MALRLTVHFSDRAARRLIVEGPEATVVGRSAACDLVVDDDRVSRRHAAFELREEPPGSAPRWVVTDLGSKNGTSVGGLPVPADGAVALPAVGWLDLGGVPVQVELLSAERLREERGRPERLWRSTARLRDRLDGADADDGSGVAGAAGAPQPKLARLLGRTLDSVLELTGGERAFLLLHGEPSGAGRVASPDVVSPDEAPGGDGADVPAGGSLTVAAVAGLVADDLLRPAFAGSVGAVERCRATGRPVVLTDLRGDSDLGARASIVAGRIRRLVCLPLEAAGRPLGFVYADAFGEPAEGDPFTELDLEILESLVGHAALAIAAVRLERRAGAIAAALPTLSTPATEATPSTSGEGTAGGGRDWDAILAAQTQGPGPAWDSRAAADRGPA